MKPILFKVTEKEDASFHVQINRQAHQYDQLHLHPEFQISLIVEGNGACSIGGRLDRFQPGDVYMIGPNVPHVFKNDDEHYRSDNPAQSHIVSLFFQKSSFGEQFFQLPEMAAICTFLHTCAEGVKLGKLLSEKLRPEIFRLADQAGAARIIQLLSILNQIALSDDRTYLSAEAPPAPPPSVPYPRLHRIIQYIADNFDRPISLDEAARTVNLSKYAFCRFFKRSTHKSFIHYLNEFRVSKACKLLSGNTYSITQISLLTGFNNLSYFNRQFKKFMNCTPSEYRDWLYNVV